MAFLVLLVAIVAAVATSSLSFLFRVPFIGVVASLLLIIGLTGVFFPMYYLSPDTPVSISHAVPEAAIAAIGWTILQALFQLYIAVAADPTEHVEGTERVYIQDRFPDQPDDLFYEDRYRVMQQNLKDLGALSYLGCFDTLGEAIDRIYTWMDDHPYGIDDNTLAHYGKRYGPHGDEIMDNDEYQRRYPGAPV